MDISDISTCSLPGFLRTKARRLSFIIQQMKIHLVLFFWGEKILFASLFGTANRNVAELLTKISYRCYGMVHRKRTGRYKYQVKFWRGQPKTRQVLFSGGQLFI